MSRLRLVKSIEQMEKNPESNYMNHNIYRDLLDHQMDMICRISLDFKLIYTNTSCGQFLQRSERELCGASFLSWFPIEDQAICRKQLTMISPLGKKRNWICKVENRFGQSQTFWWTATGAFYEGKLIEIHCTGKNMNEIGPITQLCGLTPELMEGSQAPTLEGDGQSRVNHLSSIEGNELLIEADTDLCMKKDELTTFEGYQNNLQNKEGSYKVLFNTMEVGLVICQVLYDDEGHPFDYVILDANQAAEQASAYLTADWIGCSINEMDASWALTWLDVCKQVARTGEPTHFRIKNSISHAVYEVSTFCSLPDQIASLFFEITDLIAMEKKMAGQLDFLQTLIDTIPNPVYFKDFNGRYFNCNQAFESYVGFSKEEIIGQTVYELVSKESADKFYAMEQVLKLNPGILLSESWSFLHNDGVLRDLLINKTTFSDYNGNLTGIVGVFTDITDRKQIEKKMARLEQLNLVGEMAASIGHEIRNPMTTVRGFLQMLQSQPECATIQPYFDLMIEEIDRANEIITEFLTLAKDRPVELREANLNDTLRGIAMIMEAEARKTDKHIHLLMGDIPTILLDSQQIRQVILNLVSNGLEAMQAGGTITIKTYEEDKYVVLSVQDEGEGIDPEIIDKLGTPFVTTKDTGTGLGLAVCYSIAARHGAMVDFSTDEKGTTFFVRFGIGTPC